MKDIAEFEGIEEIRHNSMPSTRSNKYSGNK